ncbi:unnamed protein product [Parascedosporium putredinis]|uniref:AAA+ ATPase domain-containing protein n=1 Tax=Parascedosporium putredinis TaxID=1442378 RepID=A0A9P1GZM8_9PEZI|nr:unnamed protein product [Parascedosporium putredinis]CAI7991948.1 unnamed protein product [Parascedosporium putredinis]
MATDNTAFQYDSILRGEFFQDIAEDVADEVDGDGDGDGDDDDDADADGEDDVDDHAGTPPVSPRPKRASAQPQPDKTEASDWIPELKKVVQLTGDDGYTHIIGLESYTPAARPSRKDNEDEKQPFEEYAVLLKAVIERYEKRARFQLELQSEGKLKALSLAPETDESTRKALGLLVDFIHSPMGHQRLIDAYNELPVLFQDSAEKESNGMGCILESVEFEEKEDEKPTWNLNFYAVTTMGTGFTSNATYTPWNTFLECFLHYKGPASLTVGDCERRLVDLDSAFEVDERVIIDRKSETQFSKIDDNLGVTVGSCFADYLRTGDATFQEEWMVDPKSYVKADDPDLSDDDYFMCRNNIVGFVVGQKVWVQYIRTSSLTEIEWGRDPFRSLQLGEERKRLVHRLVTGFANDKTDAYDDVVAGKGKGLIFLLHGPPGLGKTLTAESVAESAKRPLYRITTGELSTEVQTLESQLTDIFKIGARWKAVVLLDEADVLMSRRTVEDLRRNSIVAVFLRLLEYYKGLLFLTTNRHDDFDEAFWSRIHVTIQYKELTAAWKTNIWREHIQRACMNNSKENLWTEEMFQVLGELASNGRDIKNYARTAYAFARAEDEDVILDHILIVLRNNLHERILNAHVDVFSKLDLLTKKKLRQ